jgi:hypothetical protein
LLAESHAHLHVDLIFALPGESMQSFADGFDRLYALQPHEIQLGILKRLRGTPIAQHSVEFGMVYDTEPPYTIQQTGAVDRDTLLRFTRFARYWELLANSGRFNATIKHLLRIPVSRPAANRQNSQGGEEFSPFYAFLALSDWLWQRTGKTHALTPEYLVDALFEYLVSVRGAAEGDEKMASAVKAILLADYLASGARGKPQALQDLLPGRRAPLSQKHPPPRQLMQRQDRHLSNKNFADQKKHE